VYPTKALAKHAGLSQKAYTDQIIKSCFLNRRSPIDEWRHVHAHQKEQIKTRFQRFRSALGSREYGEKTGDGTSEEREKDGYL
jgi:hypothetical protein